MDHKTAIVDAIFDAIDEVNAERPLLKLDKSLDAVLLGEGSSLDSLDLVTLIVAVEEKIHLRLGLSITLADERAMSAMSSPFRTVGTLADYIEPLIAEHVS